MEGMEKLSGDLFLNRHLGPNDRDIKKMLQALGFNDLSSFLSKVIPKEIYSTKKIDLAEAKDESSALEDLKKLSNENKVFKSWIGMGYSNCILPSVIKRNILENPGWYTQYTPYQPEISQGRLESLLNFQTLISDLTGLPIANASLLDEATAAAEAFMLSYAESGRNLKKIYFISKHCHPQTIDVILGRAKNLGIEVVVGDPNEFNDFEKLFGVILQYPGTDGVIYDDAQFIKTCKEHSVLVGLACDLLSLVLLKTPGELGADIAFGNSQRFGVPLAFGGPHAAFFAVTENLMRKIPGRIVGVSKDVTGKKAYRLGLQTREQHIRREKATSNICTAQALLANVSAMYAVYHGPEGLYKIANRVHSFAVTLKENLKIHGFEIEEQPFFDTVQIKVKQGIDSILEKAWSKNTNFRKLNSQTLTIALDETTTFKDIETIISIFSSAENVKLSSLSKKSPLNEKHLRKTEFLKHEVFHKYRSETEMLRYIKKLENKDISLTHSMIPLGSCTMKLNATTEMEPITWDQFANIHPFAPSFQSEGYRKLSKDLCDYLAKLTGFSAVSLQPNSGAQGEYAGLSVIREYQRSRGEGQRDICIIPSSAHGTNPASAVLAGMKVVTVECDKNGNVDISDLEKKVLQFRDHLSAFMITYPSTHGVFESQIKYYCDLIHRNGGQVYMDGANFNAQIGLCYPSDLGADVCHLNLHKTFCIPHGGGGPGAGPIAVREQLKEFLPGHSVAEGVGGSKAINAVAAAPYGNAGILPIPYLYIQMMGFEGLKKATSVAILNANYIAHRLEPHYEVLYKGDHKRVAHECIIDARKFKKTAGIEVSDIAKRLMDYGFHAPTISFPVAGTLMIEPTESESLEELDRFCEAMLAIREEISAIEEGRSSSTNNVLKNAPHTYEVLMKSDWDKPYSRELAAFPREYLRENKYWPPVSRIDEAYGDRNFSCTCNP